MKKGIVLDVEDIKQLISEKYNVSTDKIIKSQYSYIVITDEEKEPDKQ